MAEPDRLPDPPQHDDPVIRPVSYRPAEETAGPRLPLTPLQLTLLVAVLLVAGGLWFLFTAKSVRLEFVPAVADAELSGGLHLALGDVWLMRRGDYRMTARAPGYAPLETTFEIGEPRNQTHRFELTRLPGRVTFDSEPPGAEITVAGETLGVTPSEPFDIPAGPVTVTLSKPRYQPLTFTDQVIGMQQPQTLAGELVPNWANVTITSQPPNAEIFVDDEPTGQTTPAVVEILAGEHEVRLKAPGHRSHRQRVLVAAQETVALPEATLERADALLTVRSVPAGAGITLNGRFQGETPLELAVQSGVAYRLQAFRAGYEPAERSLELASGAERTVTLDLDQLTGTLVVQSQPDNAQLYVNGEPRGSANQTLELPAQPQQVEVRLPGYAGYRTEITPREGITQELRVRLLTIEEARLAALTPEITTSEGQQLVLVRPDDFTMGASRRQPGRRANETLREVSMSRLFYLGRHEVTNAQFRRFAPGHDSGTFQDYSLNEDEQPVVNVSWEDAARYCNWLSNQEGLPRFYRTENGKVVGFDPTATGYRLPTEAEFAWSARQVAAREAIEVQDDPDQELRFPWGNGLPPPDRHGNYADRSAANLVGRIIFGYNDNHTVAAPPGTFAADRLGVYDLAGNVAEWVNDFYEIPDPAAVSDPLGPESGEYHGIRGSSWMHGTITDLRLPFRDYGSDGRADVGFRLARFAEQP